MCQQQTIIGLPIQPLPQDTNKCPVCLMSKFSHQPRGKTITTDHLQPGELLHLDFTFGTNNLLVALHECFSLMMPKPECFSYSSPATKEHL
jgi:hypothetical protein